MATSEPTTSSTEMLLPVSVEKFFKWSDLKDIHLSDLKDSPEDTAGRETSHTLDFQQDSPASIEEPQEEPALMQQKGHKWRNWLTFGRSRRVASKSPTGKSKSLSSSQQSHKSQPSPQSPGQKMAREVFPEMFVTVRPSAIINLATITDQVGVPQEVAGVSCSEVGILPIVYSRRYNLGSAPNLRFSDDQKMLNAIPAYMYYQLQAHISGSLYVKWKAVDISSVYDISHYVSVHIKQCNVTKIAEMMKLVLPKQVPSWEVFSSVVLCPLRVQMMGSVVACKLALDEGWAINIGGGFGHFTTNISGGLAMYDDVLVCLAVMSNFPNVKHIGVINLDAYQAPNYQYAKNINCNVTIIDVYTKKMVEKVKVTGYTHDDRSELVTGGILNKRIDYHGFDASVDLETHTLDAYMDYVKRLIVKCFVEDKVKPSLCIYVRGTTLIDKNPPTKLDFNRKDVMTLDKAVFELITSHNINIAVLLGGGYQIEHAEASAISICQLMRWWTALKGDLSTLKA